MKKLTALLLTLCLCMCMAVPAFAAFPETWDEAKQNIYITNDLYKAGYDTWVPLATDLYDGLTDEIEFSHKISGFYAVPADCLYTYLNVGSSDEYFLWVSADVYSVDEEGRYVLLEVPASSLRNNGEFITRAMNEDASVGDPTYARRELGPTEGAAFTFDSLDYKQGDLIQLTYYQEYPAEGRYWYTSIYYLVDDELAASMVKLIDAVKAEEEAQNANPFTDVAADAYYYDAVLWAVENGITNGTSATTFGPEATCTRGQVVTFLWRAKGCPEPTSTANPFTDVTEADYFYKPVLWAVENGITNGTSATTFSPQNTCTSGQVITFLWRANGQPAAETEGTEWYAQAVAWANGKQLLDGTAVAFAPDNQAPRADIVTYLYRDLAK